MFNLENIANAFEIAKQASVNIVVPSKFDKLGYVIECMVLKPTAIGVCGKFVVKEKQQIESGEDTITNLNIKLAYTLSFIKASGELKIQVDNNMTELGFITKTCNLGFEDLARESFENALTHLSDPVNHERFIKEARESSCNVLSNNFIGSDVVSEIF
jgi:hypothetical protein